MTRFVEIDGQRKPETRHTALFNILTQEAEELSDAYFSSFNTETQTLLTKI